MSPAEELRFLILGTQREGNRFFSALLAPLGLTPSQAEVLRCLAEADGLSLNALGRRLVCETGSPSRLVTSLVDRGLIERQDNPGDRRQVTLSLSEAGAQLAREVAAVEKRLHGWIEERLAPEEIATVSDGLRRMLAGTAAGNAVRERLHTAGKSKGHSRRRA
jgi:DNA-binding MarR family transcriptional regulator